MYKLNFLLFSFLLIIFCNAQPTITSAWAPVTGISYKVTALDGSLGLSEGSSGANQTWDLSNADTISSQMATYISPSSAPNISTYPGCTDVVSSLSTGGNLSYQYNKLNSTTYQLLGLSQSSSNYVLNYVSDPQDIFHFPMTYNSNFNDAFKGSGSFTSGGQSGTLVRKGTVTVTSDGYGTLKTYYGTFSNVLRVKIVQNVVDTFTIAGSKTVAIGYFETYDWVSAANRGIILASVTHGTQNGVSNDYGTVSQVITTGIDEPNSSENMEMSIVPVPVKNTAHLEFTLQQTSSNVNISIHNMLGQIVYSTTNNTFESGRNRVEIPAGNLENGPYLVSLKTDNAQFSKRIIVQR